MFEVLCTLIETVGSVICCVVLGVSLIVAVQ